MILKELGMALGLIPEMDLDVTPSPPQNGVRI